MRKVQKPALAPALGRYDRIAAGILGLGVCIIPILYTNGSMDAFRLPKESAFRALAIAVLLLAVFTATSIHSSWRSLLEDIPRSELILCAAIAGWTIVATVLSSNLLLSLDSLITVLAALAIYLGLRRLVPHLPLTALDVCLLPGIVNAVVIVLQETGTWNPFTFPDYVTGHAQSTSLLGHPNDAGVYLMGTTVVAIVGAATLRRRRWIYALVAIVAIAGLVASGTRSAMIAAAVAIIALAVLRPWRQSLVILAALIVAVATSFAVSPFIRGHFAKLVDAARTRQYDVLLSERLIPFMAAADMARKHPFAGVGPGCFKYYYMDERLALTRQLPQTLSRSWPQNFAETHNDHLQVTAETGLPGYVLLIAALVLIVSVARTRVTAASRPQAVFARAFAIPLAVAFFVVAMAQFPLQVASTRMMFLTFAALVRGWESRNA